MTDLYAVLGVSPRAEPAAVRAAWLALLQTHHPDRAAGDRTAAEARTKEINAAFAVLGDPARRAAYDRTRGEAAASPAPAAMRRPSPALGAGPTRRALARTPPAGRAAVVAAIAVAALTVAAALTPAARSTRDPGGAEPAAATAPALPAEVMLAWPTAAKTCSAGELTVSVSGRILKVRDGAGRTGALTLPADADLGSARFGVGRLDPESDAAAVLAGWRRKGDAGHAALVVLDRVDGRWRTLELGTWPGAPPEAFPGELDGDGAPELVLADRRFEGVFGPPDQALYPPQLLQIRAGQPVDVSASGRFVDLYRHEMEAARPICFLGADAACAAYAADAARAGRAAQAWALLGERAGGVDKALPARLGAFLVRTGYLERVPDPQTAQAGARGE